METKHLKVVILFLLFLATLGQATLLLAQVSEPKPVKNTSLVVLGIAQDAGYPHLACKKECCKNAWGKLTEKKLVSCLGLINPETDETWLFDATPDITDQAMRLSQYAGHEKHKMPSGIFLTHAHIGHYTGLMYLGREVAGAKEVPVYVMPKMNAFLEANGPWKQLVKLKNISLQEIQENVQVTLASNIKITPLKVPHRDEYSETVGYIIAGPKKKALFIPDIDKWSKWGKDLAKEISKIDYAFLDATFYKNGEIAGRDMSEIPHPFVEETMNMLKGLSKTEKEKLFFIHLNHTNPLLKSNSEERKEVRELGFNVADEGMVFEL